MGHMKTLTINGQTFNVVSPTPVASVALKAEAWVGRESPYLQVVTLPGVTPHSKVNLQPSAEQLEVFREKDLGFTTKNAGGVVTAYAVGVKPQNDYTMQVTVEEVSEQYTEQGTAIWGDTVGTPLSPDKISSELAPLNVIISGNDTDGYTANATHSDIEDYYSVGRYAHCSLGDLVLPLVSWNQGKAVFAAIVEGREIRVEIDRDNKVSVFRVAGGGSVEIDKTLTKEGAAADAKAVGDALDSITKTVFIEVHYSGVDENGERQYSAEPGTYEKVTELWLSGHNVICKALNIDGLGNQVSYMEFHFRYPPRKSPNDQSYYGPIIFSCADIKSLSELELYQNDTATIYGYEVICADEDVIAAYGWGEVRGSTFTLCHTNYPDGEDDSWPLDPMCAAYLFPVEVDEKGTIGLHVLGSAGERNNRYQCEAQILGVDDGKFDFSAVNLRQLNTKITAPDSAEVGQTLVVKEVEENGKPVSWECVSVYSREEIEVALGAYITDIDNLLGGDV